jgi:hypothetical protein
MKRVVVPLAVVVALLTANSGQVRASDECRLFAEVSVAAIKSGSMVVCLRSASPVACAVAAASRDAATSGVAKKGLSAGCDWAVERVGRLVRIRITGRRKEAEKAKEELSRAKELRWRERAP